MTLSINAKARVAQLTGFRSIAAAAEMLVTFGCFFYRWKARLWVRWGSSCATGDGGRLIAAPTAENGPSHNQGRSPHPSGLRPAPLPLLAFSHFPLTGGIGLPLKGKAFGRLIAAPTAGTGLGRWFGNGRRRSGTAATSIFFPLRPPVGPDGTAPKHS